MVSPVIYFFDISFFLLCRHFVENTDREREKKNQGKMHPVGTHKFNRAVDRKLIGVALCHRLEWVP